MFCLRKLNQLSDFNELLHCNDINDLSIRFLDRNMMDKVKAEQSFQYELSAWKFDKDDIDSALKAALLASGISKDYCFVILDLDQLSEAGIVIENSNGDTGYIKGRSLHVNLKELTYGKIGKVLSMCLLSAQNNAFKGRFRKKDFDSMLPDMIKNGDIDYSCLSQSLLKHIVEFAQKENLTQFIPKHIVSSVII